MNSQPTMEEIISLCKRKGFVFQASEIYGGLAGFWDYGPLGVELVTNLKSEWWKAMVHEHNNIYGLDSAIIQNPKLWEASEHVSNFTDPLVDCKKCGARHRADHLAGTDSTDIAELKELLRDQTCPTCGEKDLTEPRYYNMMMKTWVGPIEDDSSIAYLRPETAGPIFTNYENVRETMRAKLPFGIAQIGKAFRNEISPRDFIFRVRELEQMEMQYFIKPETQHSVYESWREFAWKFLTERLKLNPENLKWHEHNEKERAHYAAAAHDIYFKFPQGFKELWGTHNRTDFDLGNHTRVSGKKLDYFEEETKDRFTPYVIESSVGVGRMLLAVLTDVYRVEEVDGETRIVLKFAPHIAPVKVAILPLMKKDGLAEKALEIASELRKNYVVQYDETGSIGKRYRRQDEIGTPYCITVDYDTLKDATVTLRDRDTMLQERIPLQDLSSYLEKKFN